MQISTSARAVIAALGLTLALGGCDDEKKKRPVGGVCGVGSDCELGLCADNLCLDPAGDEDGDGLTNGFEWEIGSNPFSNDTDGDGILDRDELGPNLELIDTDGDGLLDIIESAIEDQDADCIPDQYDAENLIPNSDLSPMRDVVCPDVGICADVARELFGVTCPDGVNAECIFANVPGYEPVEVSCDGLDNNCDGVADEGFPDLDGDGVADCVDPDLDGDGVANAVDNCPTTANPLQEGAGGIGDACASDYTFAFPVALPGTVTASVPFPLTVEVRGPDDTLTTRFSGDVVLSIAGAGGPVAAPTVAGTQTATAVGGIATFTGVIVTEPGEGLRILASSGLLTPAASEPFDAVTGDFDRITFSDIPAPAVAGAAFATLVAARDIHGNILADYTGTVSFESSDPSATLPSDTTFTAADAGAHTLDFTLRRAGAQTITVRDTSANAVLGTAEVTVVPAAMEGFALSGIPSPITAGESFTVTVSAVDAFGNVVPSFTGAVRFSSSDPQALLPGDVVFSAADAGVVEVQVTFRTSGEQSLQAADVASGALAGAAVTGVGHAEAHDLVVTVLTAPLTAGQEALVEVRVVDAFGNVVTDFTGTVGLTSSDPGAELPSTYTFTPSDAGVHVFTVVLVSAGDQAVGAIDDSGELSGASPVVVELGEGLALDVTTPAAPVAGVPFAPTIRVTDAFGNTIHEFEGVITLSSSDPAAILPGPVTVTLADAGVVTAGNVELRTSGSQWLRAAVAGSDVFWQRTLNVAAAAPRDLRATPVSGTVTAGTAFTVNVRVEDAFGNAASGYTGTVSFASSDPNAILPGAITFSAANAGVASVQVTLRSQGAQTITVSGTSLTGVSTVELSRAVDAAPFSALVLTPSTMTPAAGEVFSLAISPQDAHGNVIASNVGTSFITTTPPGGGPDVAVITGETVINPYSFTAAGPAQIQVTIGDVTGQVTVTVQPGPPAGLTFIAQPADGEAGSPLAAVRVAVSDAYDNPVTDVEPTQIAIRLNRWASQGAFTGTFDAMTSGGVATFADLTISEAGVGWTLVAAGAGFSVVSDPFDTVWRAPEIVGTPQVTASAGCRYVNYTVRQDDARPVDVLVEYRVGTGVWRRATQAPSVAGEASGVYGVRSTLTGVAHSFKWDAEGDLGETNLANVQVRLTPSVEASVGTPVTTATFTVNNAWAAKVVPLAHQPTTDQPTTEFIPVGLAVGDFDRNGLDDIAVANGVQGAGARFTVFFQTTPGVYSEKPFNVNDDLERRYVDLMATPNLGGDAGDDLIALDNEHNRLDLISGNRVGVSNVSWTVAPSNSEACAWAGTGPTPVALATGTFYQSLMALVACWDDSANGQGWLAILGSGQGNFGIYERHQVDARPYGIASADLGRDGYTDVVVAHENGVQVFANYSGWGEELLCPQCDASVTIGLGRSVHLALGHLDRNGDLDLVVAHGDTRVSIVPGNTTYDGQGNTTSYFNAAGVVEQTFPAAISRVALADVDGDGNIDIIAASKTADAVYVLRGNGALGFNGPVTTFSTGGVSGFGAIGLVARDLNRDGRMDIAIARADPATATRGARVVESAPRAICEARPNAPSFAPLQTNQVSRSTMRDVDGDGKVDWLIAGTGLRTRTIGAAADVYGHGFAIAYGDGGGGHEWETAAYTGASSSLWDVGFGHFNADTQLDAVVLDGYTDGFSPYVVLRDANHETGWRELNPFPALARTGQMRPLVAVGDVNNDGTDDIVYATNSQSIVVQYQSTPANFTTVGTPLAVEGGAQGLALADLNFDGFLDLGFAHKDAKEVCVQMASSLGRYASTVDATRCYADDNVTSAVHFVDLNGDRQHELVFLSNASNSSPSHVRIRTQSPPESGRFPNLTSLEVCAAAADLAIADFNGSGRLDLAVSCGQNIGVGQVYLQNPNGTFSGMTFDATLSDGLKVAAGDVDGDGAADLALDGAVLGVASDRLAEPDSVAIAPATGTPPTALWIGDVDQDGINDILSWTTGGALTLYTTRGLGDGDFAAPTAQTLGTGTQRAVAVGDVYGDGRVEAILGVTTATETQELRIHRQSSTAGVFDGAWPVFVLGSVPTEIVLRSVQNRKGSGILIRRGVAPNMQIELFDFDGSYGFSRISTALNVATFDAIGLGRFHGAGGMLSAVTAGPCGSPVDTTCVLVWTVTCSVNTAGCFFTSKTALTLPTSHSVAGLLVADLNHNGYDDIVLVTNQPINSGTSRYYHLVTQSSATPGTFQQVRTFAGLPGAASRVTFADINGDGRLDILTRASNWRFNGIDVLLQGRDAGQVVFDAPFPFGSTLNTYTWQAAFAVGDLDGDGRPDIVDLGDNTLTARILYTR